MARVGAAPAMGRAFAHFRNAVATFGALQAELLARGTNWVVILDLHEHDRGGRPAHFRAR